MPFNPLAGKQASATVGSTAMAWDSFKISMKNGLSKITNFTSQGCADFLAGINDSKITCSGPYDQGNVNLTTGTIVQLTLTYTTSVSFTVTALVESIDPDVKVEDAQRYQVVFQQKGVFTPTLV